MPNLKRTPSSKPAHARTNFDDRLSAAAAAKQALLERFRSRPSVGRSGVDRAAGRSESDR